MANTNLPNIVSTLTDGNLDTSRIVDLGDSILIIGTSSRGPKNQPINVTGMGVDDVERIFGPKEQGNLVRGFIEASAAPGGTKDIRLCRITNGKRAKLELYEKLGSGLEEESYVSPGTRAVALTIEARDPGEIYNQVSFRQDFVNGRVSVVGYNPISQQETVIVYDKTGNVAGAVKNVVDLANAINADPNLGSIVQAKPSEFTTEYTLKLSPNYVAASGSFSESKFAIDSGGTMELSLGYALLAADTNDDGYTDDTNIILPSGVPITGGNNLLRISEVSEMVNVKAELNSHGYGVVSLPYPAQTVNGVAKAFLDVDTGNSSGDGSARHKIVNGFIGTGDGSTTEFEFTAWEPIDTATFKVYRTLVSGSTVEVPSSQWTLASIGGQANGYKAQLVFNNAPADNATITVSYLSEKFNLTKVNTLAACKASNSYRTYFVAGDKVYFGTAQPSDMIIQYPARKIYNVGTDVVIEDSANGVISFTNPDKQPSYAQNGAVLLLSYSYMPEWVDLGTAAQSLKYGTNGIVMTNEEKYKVLAELYEAIADYRVKCVVVMGTYLDDTKTIYDDETGLPVTVNAGFAQQLENFLANLQDGVVEAYGVMAVRPVEGTTPSDINTWVTKLTEVSLADQNRAANVMRSLDAPHLSIVAFEPIVNIPSFGFPYATTGEALYAGLAAKLPKNSPATTNKSLGNGVVALRVNLSSRQLDILTGARYVTARVAGNGDIVITDGVTAAKPGSDYTRFSTVKITFQAIDIVRTAGTPFVGELFNPAKRAALETAISRGLSAMRDIGVLRNFEFRIEQTNQERALGIARIPLVLYPEFELRRIETTVVLSNAA